MNYQDKINKRFGPLARPGSGSVGEKIINWLNLNHANWRNDEPNIVAEWVLREAIGWHEYDEMTAEETERAEEFVMEYIGG